MTTDAEPAKPRLLDEVRELIQIRYYSIRTEAAPGHRGVVGPLDNTGWRLVRAQLSTLLHDRQEANTTLLAERAVAPSSSLQTHLIQAYIPDVQLERAMKEVSVTELRQNLQAFLTSVSRGHRFRVTSRGKVIAEITPPQPDPDKSAAARQRLRASVVRYDDPTAPTFESGEWEMNR